MAQSFLKMRMRRKQNSGEIIGIEHFKKSLGLEACPAFGEGFDL